MLSGRNAAVYRFNAIPVKNSEIDKTILKFIRNHKTSGSKSNDKQQELGVGVEHL